MSQAGNTYISITTPSGFSGSATPVIVSDPTITVDNFAVCTHIEIAISGVIGEASYADSVTINGDSQFTTANNMSVILLGASGEGKSGSSAKVISCGQTSVMVD